MMVAGGDGVCVSSFKHICPREHVSDRACGRFYDAGKKSHKASLSRKTSGVYWERSVVPELE